MAVRMNSDPPVTRKSIEDDAALQPSFGEHVPDPNGLVKGEIVNFGWLAGSGNVRPTRSISVQDSVDSQLRNLPGAHGDADGSGKMKYRK